MEYTVNEISKLASISNRTLRYYDEIGLLPPKHIQKNGYRIYGDEEIEILSIILLYKVIGMELNEIQEIINSPDFDKLSCLNIQRNELLMKRKRLDVLIDFVEESLKNNNVRVNKSVFDCL
nr:MerR family transcriptional regulator [Staphylococcus equorum]